MVDYFHDASDPYSHLVAQVLPQLVARYDIELVPHLVQQLPGLSHLAVSYLYRGDDVSRIDRLDALAKDNGLAILATNDVHYHAPERRPLAAVHRITETMSHEVLIPSTRKVRAVTASSFPFIQ